MPYLRLFVLAAFLLLIPGCSNQPPQAEEDSRMAQDINDLFVGLRENTTRLAHKASTFFNTIDSIEGGLHPPGRYVFYEGTVYYTPVDDGGCNVWASGATPVDEELKSKISKMEHLDQHIKATAQSSEYITQSYILTGESFAFVYPFYDSVAVLPPGLDFSNSIMPFYLVDPEHNPDRSPTWVEPYIDATGKGYIITISCPIYSDKGFEGSAGSDIAILPISRDFLEPRSEAWFMVTRNTLLVAVNKPCEELLSIEGLGEYYYLEGVQEDEYASQEYRLSMHESQDIRDLASRLDGNGHFEMDIHGRRIRFHQFAIDEVDWLLVLAQSL